MISWIDFGTAKETQRREAATTLKINDDFFWSSTTRGVRFGSDAAKKFDFGIVDGSVLSSIPIEGLYTVFDSASSDAFISTAFWDSFLAKFSAEAGLKSTEFKDGYVMASCKLTYPDLYFDVDGYYLQLSAKDYVEEVDADLCKLHVRPIDAPFNVLGTQLFLEYYVTHNYGAKPNMQWAPAKDSKKDVI